MWWKLIGLAVLTVVLLVVLFVPFPTTVTLKIDLPPGATPPTSSHFETGIRWAIWVANGVVVSIILGAASWFAVRIIRGSRKLK